MFGRLICFDYILTALTSNIEMNLKMESIMAKTTPSLSAAEMLDDLENQAKNNHSAATHYGVSSESNQERGAGVTRKYIIPYAVSFAMTAVADYFSTSYEVTKDFSAAMTLAYDTSELATGLWVNRILRADANDISFVAKSTIHLAASFGVAYGEPLLRAYLASAMTPPVALLVNAAAKTVSGGIAQQLVEGGYTKLSRCVSGLFHHRAASVPEVVQQNQVGRGLSP